MGKIKDPINFSTAFSVDKKDVIESGVVDVILNADTNLFIDPLLLEESSHDEIGKSAHSRYRKHFEQIIKLLAASKNPGDVAWRGAKRLFQFHEISWTCLGYGGSVRGSGFGPELIESTLKTAQEIVELGVTDVDLFMALALFEEGIGPDRISDMTTNIILADLVEFNERIARDLSLPTELHTVSGKEHYLLTNPRSDKGDPLLLVPSDIVRDLPIASDWSDISRVVMENQLLRDQVNDQIGSIWATMSKKEKKRIKTAALRDKASFETILQMLHEAKGVPYDIKSDPAGEVFWGDLIARVALQFPKDLTSFQGKLEDRSTLMAVVAEIIEQFRFLVEERDLWRELWDEKLSKHRKEKAAQRLFFAVADSYCKSNNLDLTPEAETGNGPVDFKVSSGYTGKVLVEIKLSTNPRLLHGYERQLEIYRDAEKTTDAYFLVLDVGSLGTKDQQLIYLKNKQVEAGQKASEIVFVDGTPRRSASKRA